MENYSTALKYTETSANSAGTSLEKMRVYEDSIEAKTKSLTATFQALSSSLVNSGLLKAIIDFGINLLKVLNIGDGVIVQLVLLTATISALSMVSKTAIFTTFISGMKSAITLIPRLIGEIIALATAEKGAAVTTGILSTALTFLEKHPILIALTALVAVFTLVTSSAKKVNAEMEKNKQQAISNAKASQELYDGLQKLTEEYKTLAKQTSLTEENKTRLKSIQDELIKTYGLEANSIDLVNGKYNTQIETLNKLNATELENSVYKQYVATDIAKQDFEKNTNDTFYLNGIKNKKASKISDSLNTINGMNSRKVYQTKDTSNLQLSFDEGSNSAERYVTINKALKKLNAEGITSGKVFDELLALQIHYDNETKNLSDNLTIEISALEKSGLNAKKLAEDKALLLEIQRTLTAETREEIYAIDSADEALEYLRRTAESTAETTEKLALSAEELAKKFEEVKTKIKDAEGEISNLNGIMQDLNEGQLLSAEQIIELLDKYPQLVSSIKKVEGGYKLETSALEELRDAKINEVVDAGNIETELSLIVLNETAARIGQYEDEIAKITDLQTAKQAILDIEKQLYEEALHIQSADDVKNYSVSQTNAKEEEVGISGYIDKENAKKAKEDALKELGKDKPSSSSDPYLERYEQDRKVLDRKLALKEITESEHLNRLEKLNDNYFKNKAKYEDKYWDNVVSIRDGRLKIEKEAISSEIDLLKEEMDIYNNQLEDAKTQALKPYQDKLNLLQSQKEEIDLQLKSQQALDAYNNAKKQASNYVFRNGEFGFEKNETNIAETKKAYEDSLLEIEEKNLENEIANTETYYKTQIDSASNFYAKIIEILTANSNDLDGKETQHNRSVYEKTMGTDVTKSLIEGTLSPASSINLTDFLRNNNISDLMSQRVQGFVSPSSVMSTNNNTTMGNSIGNITVSVYDATNVDDIVDAIMVEFPSKLSQAINKK